MESPTPIFAPLSVGPPFNNPQAELRCNLYTRLAILPEMFIDYSSEGFDQIYEVLKSSHLHLLWHTGDQLPYFPKLVAQFYANLITISVDGSTSIQTTVRGYTIQITSEKLAALLRLPPNFTVGLPEVFNDTAVLSRLTPTASVVTNAVELFPLPRILAKIIKHNLLPKSGSKNYVSAPAFSILYAIMSRRPVNWAEFFIGQLSQQIKVTLPHPCLITLILNGFGISTIGEEDKFNQVTLNKHTLVLMKVSLLGPADNDDEELPSPTPKSTPGSSSGSKRGRFFGRKSVAHKSTGSSGASPSSPASSASLQSLSTAIQSLATTTHDGFSGIQSLISQQDATQQQTNRLLGDIQLSLTNLVSQFENSTYPPGRSSSSSSSHGRSTSSGRRSRGRR